MTGTVQTQELFSKRMRTSTWGSHEQIEGAPIVTELSSGALDRSRYFDLLAQYHCVYAALEKVGELLAKHPVAGRFIFPELLRTAALGADLEYLEGPDWRLKIAASRATVNYCTRLEECASWPAGFVAHHYTRYMGDLSGGQMIKRSLETRYGYGPNTGARFFLFDQIPDIRAFKHEYRRRLDLGPWDESERVRIIDEVLLAYEHNRNVLAGLQGQGAETL
ncbi:MAG: biliverdin-producing heme oxygenase [Actinomycetota bacterium]